MLNDIERYCPPQKMNKRTRLWSALFLSNLNLYLSIGIQNTDGTEPGSLRWDRRGTWASRALRGGHRPGYVCLRCGAQINDKR